MTSAVDSNVLFDILLVDSAFGETSEQALRTCLRDGPVLVCPIIYAELAAAMMEGDIDRFLSDLLITVDQFRGLAAARDTGLSDWSPVRLQDLLPAGG